MQELQKSAIFKRFLFQPYKKHSWILICIKLLEVRITLCGSVNFRKSLPLNHKIFDKLYIKEFTISAASTDQNWELFNYIFFEIFRDKVKRGVICLPEQKTAWLPFRRLM